MSAIYLPRGTISGRNVSSLTVPGVTAADQSTLVAFVDVDVAAVPAPATAFPWGGMQADVNGAANGATHKVWNIVCPVLLGYGTTDDFKVTFTAPVALAAMTVCELRSVPDIATEPGAQCAATVTSTAPDSSALDGVVADSLMLGCVAWRRNSIFVGALTPTPPAMLGQQLFTGNQLQINLGMTEVVCPVEAAGSYNISGTLPVAVEWVAVARWFYTIPRATRRVTVRAGARLITARAT